MHFKPSLLFSVNFGQLRSPSVFRPSRISSKNVSASKVHAVFGSQPLKFCTCSICPYQSVIERCVIFSVVFRQTFFSFVLGGIFGSSGPNFLQNTINKNTPFVWTDTSIRRVPRFRVKRPKNGVNFWTLLREKCKN